MWETSSLSEEKGLYVVTLYEGQYFRQPLTERATSKKNAILEHPLYEPLRSIGVDGPAIARLFEHHSPAQIERWVRITDAAMHERPKGFPGFRASPAAFLIDGIQKNRMPPDWWHAHEKHEERKQFEREKALRHQSGEESRSEYQRQRDAALKALLESPEGRKLYAESYPTLLILHQAKDPDGFQEAAKKATRDRVEKLAFHFPDFEAWQVQQEAKRGD